MKIGTIGTGVIVDAFIEAAKLVDGVEFVASYSRTIDKAQDFAHKHGINDAYDDLETMMKSDLIDTIYIASPNSLHYPQTLLAIDHGKNVIVEKPFTGTIETAQKIYDRAIEQGVYVFEAICNLYMPHFEVIKNLINDIGNVKMVQANYSQYSSRYDLLKEGTVTNVFNPDFSGGALADINIYNLHFAVRLFGEPKTINYIANTYKNGIDTSGVLTLKYDDFVMSLSGAKDSASKNFVQIQGDEGYIYVPNGSNGLEKVVYHQNNQTTEYNDQDKPRLYYQVLEFQNVIDEGNYDIMLENLEHSLTVVELAEKARKQIDLKFKE